MTTSQSRDSRGGGRSGTRRFTSRRRRQCVCKEVGTVSYKDVSVLRRFISDRGRIESGRKSGNCAKCQREVRTAIARARHLALLPFAPNHTRVTGSISPATSTSEDEESEESEDSEEIEAEAENATEVSAEESTAEESEEATGDVEPSEESDDSDQDEDSENSEEEDKG